MLAPAAAGDRYCKAQGQAQKATCPATTPASIGEILKRRGGGHACSYRLARPASTCLSFAPEQKGTIADPVEFDQRIPMESVAFTVRLDEEPFPSS
jgi:hypothetical protein